MDIISPRHRALLVVAGFAASAAHAGNTTLDPMVITATRQPTSIEDLVLPVIVIDRAQIERSLADDLAQLLRFQAGIDIGRNGGPGQSTSTFIRGAESNHTLVLVDGVRINPGTLGLPAIQNIRPEIIERVEIVKGNRSSLYGTDAIGGVINVITRRGAAGPRLDLGVGGGRYGTREATAAIGAAAGATDLDLTVAYAQTEGFPARRGSAIENGHDNLNVNLGTRTRVGEATVGVRYFEASGNTEYLNFSGDARDQDFRNSVAAVTLDAPLREDWTTRVDLSLAVDDIEQQQTDDVANTRRLALDWQNTVRLGLDHTLIAGLYAFGEDTDSLVFGTGFDEKTHVKAVYLEDNFRRGAHTASVAVRHTDHESFGGQTTWHADYRFELSDALSLHGGLSRGFRAPDATDRFGFGGNPALAPEVSRSAETGVTWTPVAGQRFRLGAFALDIDDLILFDFDPVTFEGRNSNIAEAQIRGVEAAYALTADDWGLRAAAVWQDPRNETTGGILPRRSRRSLTLNAYRQLRTIEVGFDLLLSGSRRDSDFSDAVNAGYALANLSARIPMPRGFELRAKIENLLDAGYETAAGFNTPGRGLYVDLYYRGR